MKKGEEFVDNDTMKYCLLSHDRFDLTGSAEGLYIPGLKTGVFRPSPLPVEIRIRGILSPMGPVPLSVGSVERYRDTPKATN